MEIITQESEIWQQCPTDFNNAISHIERAGRVCYRSEDKIVDGSGYKFVTNIVKRNHWSVIEHSNMVCKTEPSLHPAGTIDILRVKYPSAFLKFAIKEDCVYIGGNFRAWMQQLNLSSIEELFDYIDKDTELYRVDNKKNIPMLLKAITCRFRTDRAVTHELVRHRPVSYSQESQRYCAYRDQLQVIQPWHYNDLPEIIDKYTAKKYKNWLLWKSSMEQIERTYKELAGTKDSPNERPEQARSVLPNCTATRIVVTTTVPEWQFIFNLRTSKAAYPPIRHLLEPIRDIFIEKGWVV